MRWLAGLLALAALLGCAAAPATSADRPALWRATDGDTVIWLFGTIHLLPAEVRWNTGKVAAAVAASDTLITEIPAADAQAQAAAFVKLARRDGLPPVAERVAPDQRAALAAAIARAGANEGTLDRLATWAVALTLTAGTASQAEATREPAPEAVLPAAFASKRRAAFETFEGQLGLFANLPEAEQRRLLSLAIGPGTGEGQDYARLLAAWRRGDTTAIEAEARRALGNAPALADVLLTGRNRAWADELARRAAAPGTLFVAVGAGHLVGGQGVPALLSQRGFRVARVQ